MTASRPELSRWRLHRSALLTRLRNYWGSRGDSPVAGGKAGGGPLLGLDREFDRGGGREGWMEPIFDDFVEYRDRVENARITKSSDIIFNTSHRHAAALIEQLFIAAENRVRVLCEHLNPDVFGSPAVVEAANTFLARPDAGLQVIVEKEGALSNADNEFVNSILIGEQASKVEAYFLPAEKSHLANFNFMTADEHGYRFEPDRAHPIARASFNRPDMVNVLADYFEEALSSACRANLPQRVLA